MINANLHIEIVVTLLKICLMTLQSFKISNFPYFSLSNLKNKRLAKFGIKNVV